jgi:hypothetical protein
MKYNKFSRRGYTKTLDSFIVSYRVMLATQKALMYYLKKHLYRMFIILFGVVVLNQVLNNRFYKELVRNKISVEDPYLCTYLHADRNESEFVALYKIMLISSAVDLILTKTGPSDVDGSIAYYSKPYEVLANNVEIIENWESITPLIFDSQLLCQVSDLLINYKSLTYYSNQSKLKSDNILSQSILRKSARTYSNILMNIPFSSISNTESVLLAKLLIASELVSIGRDESINTEDELERKLEGLLRIIENNIRHAMSKRKLVIPEDTIKSLTRLFAIMLFQTLNETIEADVINFESSQIFNASITNPVTYQFIQHRSDIMYEFSRQLMRKMGALHYLLKIFTQVENTELIKSIGEIILDSLPKNNLNRAISYGKGTRFTNFESNLFTASIAINIDKTILPQQIRSRRYIHQIETKLSTFDRIKTEFNSQLIWRNLLNMSVIITISTIAYTTPGMLLYIRADYGKYLFLFSTHEGWLGLSLLLLFLNLTFMFGVCYLTLQLTHNPTILGFDVPNSPIVNLFSSILRPAIWDHLKQYYKKTLAFILINILIMFLADDYQFYSYTYVINYAMYILEYGGLILLSYMCLKDILPGAIISLPAGLTSSKKVLSNQLEVVNTNKPLINYICIFANKDGAVYRSIETWIPTTSYFSYNLIINLVFPTFILIVLAFLKIKLWHLPGAPEEYINLF